MLSYQHNNIKHRSTIQNELALRVKVNIRGINYPAGATKDFIIEKACRDEAMKQM